MVQRVKCNAVSGVRVRIALTCVLIASIVCGLSSVRTGDADVQVERVCSSIAAEKLARSTCSAGSCRLESEERDRERGHHNGSHYAICVEPSSLKVPPSHAAK
jgi:hypothetical protein